jgi:DNA (cytosine-5)-methyltransferase 1
MNTFIDLFSGIGGFRMAAGERNGLECVLSVEKDEACRKVYEANFGDMPYGDIKTLDPRTVPDHDLLCAGFPCQSFSNAGRKLGFQDDRGTMLFYILKILEAKKPKAFLLENVANLLHHDGGRTWETVKECLEKAGYAVNYKILNALDFGSAQNRLRIIIVGHRTKLFDFGKVKGSPRKMIKDILEPSPNQPILDSNEYTIINELNYWPSTGLKFIGYLNKPVRKTGVRPNTLHLSRTHRQCNRIYSIYGSHPTLSSSEGSCRYYIYDGYDVRKLTVTECLRLQGFPDDFKLGISKTKTYNQIGNSVYVPMIEAVVQQIKEQFQ